MIYFDGQQKVTDPATPVGQAFYTVHYGGYRSESFTCGAVDDPGAGCVSNNSNSIFDATVGTTTAFGAFTKNQSGETYSFNKVAQIYTDYAKSVRHVEVWGDRIQYPDGEVLWITYDQSVPSDPLSGRRLSKVQSSTGYFLQLTYQPANWGAVKTVGIYANSAPTTPLAQFVYSDDGKQVTDLAGRTWSCSLSCDGDAFSRPWRASDGTTLPGETGAALTYTPNATNLFLTQTITRDGVPWTYTYGGLATFGDGLGDLGGPKSYKFDSVDATGPNGYHRTYALQNIIRAGDTPYPVYENEYVKSSTDELNRVTNYAFESFGSPYVPGWRLKTVTYPEGNKDQFDYDAAGNVITRTQFSKTGSGSVQQSAQFGSGTGDVGQWRPLWSKDANGNQTDFIYNAGGLLTQQLDPPDASGMRRRMIIEYEQFQPTTTVPPGFIGSGHPAATIYRKTKIRTCGVTTAAPNTCVTNEPYTTYAYLGDTQLPTAVTEVDPASPPGSQTRVTATAYDSSGRPVSVDGPLPGTGDAKYFKYDAIGRKTWEIGELAPNNLRLAKKFTYRNSDDKVTNVQSGTVSCTTACDTASLTLTVLNQTDTSYDSRRYAIRETTYNGAATYGITDQSFLDRGLLDCSAVRMNFSSLSSPSQNLACILSTPVTGANDRITKNSYDNAGQLTKVQKAYLTSDQSDYATYTYTANGKQQFVTDGDGNKAQFTYDGFDRLVKWNFPDKVTHGSVASSDYEQYAYDAAGNRTCLRRRDGSKLTFTFDALNRVASKVVAATSGGVCP